MIRQDYLLSIIALFCTLRHLFPNCRVAVSNAETVSLRLIHSCSFIFKTEQHLLRVPFMEFVLMRSWAFSGGVTVPVEGNCRDSSFGVLASQTPLWLTLPLHLSLLIIHPMSLFVLSRLTNMLVVQISMFVNRRLDSRFPRIWRLS